MKKKKITSLILGLLLTVGMAIPTSASMRTNVAIQPEANMSAAELVQLFDENNVPENKRGILTEKLEDGVLWDCYDAEKAKLVPEDFSSIDIGEGTREKSYRFEDGSFMSISVGPTENSKVEKNVLPLTEEGVPDTAGMYGNTYVNYAVRRELGGQQASFIANFFVSDYNTSMIYTSENSNGVYNSPYGERVWGFGDVLQPRMITIRERESYGQAALHRMTWITKKTVTGSWGGVGGSVNVGGTCDLYLALINSKIHISSVLPF